MKNYVVFAESDFEVSEKIAKTFSLNAVLSNMSNMSDAAVCVTGRPLVSSTWGFQLFTSEDLCRALALRKAASRLKKAASTVFQYVSVFQGFRNLTSRRSRHHEATISSAQLPQTPSSTKEKARKLSGPAVQCSASGRWQWMVTNQRLEALKNLSATRVSWTWLGPQNLIK